MTKNFSLAAVLALALAGAGSASGAETPAEAAARSDFLRQHSKVIEWNLKNSSVASRVDKNALDNSLALLANARRQIAAGKLNAAERLIDRAALPLHEMTPAAMAGRHPDTVALLAERSETLAAITEGAEEVARERKASTDFAAQARAALARSLALQQRGQLNQALAVIDEAYVMVQKESARLRDGETYYLPIAKGPADAQWADGLRRFEERQQLTEFLILEADASGLDTAPLLFGMRAADDSRRQAAELAKAQRWDLALQSLDQAYLNFENSWKQVGLEW
jgi:hypothetical protein